tara:strand:- start:2231 stop:2350 length:120 start_codon:yes stop_codon:yes gene_type:complete
MIGRSLYKDYFFADKQLYQCFGMVTLKTKEDKITRYKKL